MTKMKYKVCFHMSYPCSYGNRTRSHGKLHYCGNDLGEVMQKFLPKLTRYTSYRPDIKCTSFWIMRGPKGEQGKNVKWG